MPQLAAGDRKRVSRTTPGRGSGLPRRQLLPIKKLQGRRPRLMTRLYAREKSRAAQAEKAERAALRPLTVSGRISLTRGVDRHRL